MEAQYGNQGGPREIVLSFDDGPHPTHTPKLLDILKEQGVKAIFFVLGQNLEGQKGQEIIQRAFREGHKIGNHSYSHPDLTKLNESQVRDEIEKTQKLIGQWGPGDRFLRPPYGAHNQLVDKVARDLGYRLVFWNVDTLDWHEDYKSGGWVGHGMTQIQERHSSLVLAHDIHGTTVEKVPELIGAIKNLPNASFAEFA
jgi:peptidoglycan/xylan/chitin deacetylase (PgdA/CDA1 family)